MSLFRKKPVVIDAEKVCDLLHSATTSWKDLPHWIVEAYEKGDVVFACDGMRIRTLEGTHHASLGDWIIRGVKGELYPIKPDILEATYDEVPDEARNTGVRACG